MSTPFYNVGKEVGRVFSIGDKVAKLRTERGWTLKQLSEYSGVSVSHISAIENHTRPNPSLRQVVKLARAFNVPLTYFVDDCPTEQDSKHVPESRPQPLEHSLAAEFLRLYDEDTQKFIVSEQSKPYVALAKKLAQEGLHQDPSTLLQIIAQFMRDQRQEYTS
jgi:transcriptional regulator with XRE-family HTH domain